MTEINTVLQQLIEALRNELQQYGEILALLERQQETVMLQGTNEILPCISAIDAQSAAIQAARANRQLAQRNLAETLKQPFESPFANLIPLVPEHYRPLVSALVQENNELLQRVRQRAQHNHLLLRHSLEMMQRFITTLSPQDNSAPVHRGENALSAVEPASFYEAVV